MVEPREVREWLMRIHNAASQRNFQGTFVVSSPGSVSSARISHFYEGADQFERIEPLDGQARQVLRYNGMLIGVFELLADARTQIASVSSSIEALRDFWLAQADLDQALIGKASLAMPTGPAAAVAAAEGGH